MKIPNTRWLLATALSVALLCSLAHSQDASRWMDSINAAQSAFNRGDYAEAERLLKLAVAEAEKFGRRDIRFAMTLRYLVELYESQGKYVEAEPLYAELLGILEKEARGALDVLVSVPLLGLARVKQAQGEYTEAETHIKRAILIQEKAFGPTSPDLAAALRNYASLLRVMKRDGEAATIETRISNLDGAREKSKPEAQTQVATEEPSPEEQEERRKEKEEFRQKEQKLRQRIDKEKDPQARMDLQAELSRLSADMQHMRVLRQRASYLRSSLEQVLNRLENVKKELAETNEPERQRELEGLLANLKRMSDDLASDLADMAEYYFERGEVEKAIETISKVISLAPSDPYYEQLRKFERAKSRQ